MFFQFLLKIIVEYFHELSLVYLLKSYNIQGFVTLISLILNIS